MSQADHGGLPYYLVRLTPSGEAPTGHAYADGKTAAAAAERLSAAGDKVQVRKRVDPAGDWRAREAARLADGSYRPLPAGWDLAPVPDHFTHLSRERDGLLAFTMSAEHGLLDRQTATTPGRYLERFYPDLPEERRKQLIALVDPLAELKLTRDPAEIERIYRKGPRSCMSKRPASYASPVHPTRAYGEGDLALAYLGHLDRTFKHTRIAARCVVWPEKKRYGRIYGDAARMARALEEAGYSRGSFVGARLKVLPHGASQVIVPYVDGHGSGQLSPDRAWLTLVESGGDVPLNSQEGLVRVMGRCEVTGRGSHYLVAAEIDGRRLMVDQSHARYELDLVPTCEDDGEQLWRRRAGLVAVRGHRTPHATPGFVAAHCATCPQTGRIWLRTRLRALADGSLVDPDWYRDNVVLCALSGRRVAKAACVHHPVHGWLALDALGVDLDALLAARNPARAVA